MVRKSTADPQKDGCELKWWLMVDGKSTRSEWVFSYPATMQSAVSWRLASGGCVGWSSTCSNVSDPTRTSLRSPNFLRVKQNWTSFHPLHKHATQIETHFLHAFWIWHCINDLFPCIIQGSSFLSEVWLKAFLAGVCVQLPASWEVLKSKESFHWLSNCWKLICCHGWSSDFKCHIWSFVSKHFLELMWNHCSFPHHPPTLQLWMQCTTTMNCRMKSLFTTPDTPVCSCSAEDLSKKDMPAVGLRQDEMRKQQHFKIKVDGILTWLCLHTLTDPRWKKPSVFPSTASVEQFAACGTGEGAADRTLLQIFNFCKLSAFSIVVECLDTSSFDIIKLNCCSIPCNFFQSLLSNFFHFWLKTVITASFRWCLSELSLLNEMTVLAEATTSGSPSTNSLVIVQCGSLVGQPRGLQQSMLAFTATSSPCCILCCLIVLLVCAAKCPQSLTLANMRIP